MERRIFIGAYIVVFVFIIFLFRVWHLQVIEGEEFKKIAEQNRLRIIEIPAPRGIIYDRNNRALVRNIPFFDISIFKEDLNEAPETLSALGKLLDLRIEDVEERLEHSSVNLFEPLKLKQDISLDEVARVEARRMDFPGLQVDFVMGREYVYGELASHIIGYLGRLTLEQARDPDYRGIPRKAFIGQLGIEKVYDRILRGTAGKKIVEVDAAGKLISVVGMQQPVKGTDIRLTIDVKLQSEVEAAINGKVGSVVVLDSNSGEIMALASTPSFDPNLFARGIDYNEWERLINNPKKPFLNRALQSQYPPGSTFKIVTALAALDKGIVTDSTRFECKGSIFFGRVFKCWKEKGHGNIGLHRAIVESCDVYFYEVAKLLEIDTIAQYALDFGLGSRVGIELEGERSGIVPTAGWKRRTKNQKWYKGETLNTVIGQGYLSVTPIQMARLMAAVVNGGRLYTPHLLKDTILDNEVVGTINIKPEYLALIKRALIDVVSDRSGTGTMSRSSIVGIGGKTGTSQVVGGDMQEDVQDKFKDHAWFVAFAPEERPEITVSVFVEHGGHGGSAAAPVAKRVIEAYFKDKKSKNVQAVQTAQEDQKRTD